MWLFKKRHKTALKNGMINLYCIRCGCSIDTDIMNLSVFCPFCGNELFIPAGYYKDLLEQFDKKGTNK